MRVDTFLICWNEIETIRFTIEHYQSFCQRVVIYDNYSDDGTYELAQQMGCEMHRFGIQGELNDREYLNVKNKCWKGSEADYVIVCDSDELIYHPDIKTFLEEAKRNKVTIFKPQGINMYSNQMPEKSLLEINTGVLDENYSKTAIFSPNLKQIWFEYGCHKSDPRGNLVWDESRLYLLHYRNIGGAQRLIDRHNIYRGRMGYFNKKFKLGFHYSKEKHEGGQTDEERRAYFDHQLKKSTAFDFIRVV